MGSMTSEVSLNIQNTIYPSVHTTAMIVKFITAKVRQSFEKGRNNDDRLFHHMETGCYLRVKHGAFRGVHMIGTRESTKSLELFSDL